MSNAVKIELKNNLPILDKELDKRIKKAMKAIGATAERYAKQKCPVDTGRLRNSITFAVSGDGHRYHTYMDRNGNTYSDAIAGVRDEPKQVHIGTNVEYAIYQEFGDYKHTTGQKHFLKDALANHVDDYQKLFEAALDT